jgi:hypothetical protein
MNYFPDALLLVAWVSRVGNEKHNPGQPLHWDKSKSQDEPDAEARHMLDYFRKLPPDPGLEELGRLGHLASKAWRALGDLQRACDEERAAFEAAQLTQAAETIALYIPDPGQTVRIVWVSPTDENPCHVVGEIVEVFTADKLIRGGKKCILLCSDPVHVGTYCRVEPA